MVDVKRALTYTFKDDNWIVKILIGAIPIINPFFSLGYSFEVFKQALENKKELVLPEWDDWGGYFKSSIMIILIYLIYMLIPMIIYAIGASVMVGGAAMGADSGGGIGTAGKVAMGIGGLIYFIGFIFALIFGLMLPMVLANYAKNDESFGSIFQFGVIIKNIFSIIGDYLLTFLIIIGLMIAVGIAMGILAVINIIPVLGWIVYFIVYLLVLFWTNLVIFPLLGETCAGAYGGASKAVKKA